MQALMYAAKSLFSQILWRLGDVDDARQLYEQVEELKTRFNEKFWMEDQGYFGTGIEGKES